MPRGYDDLHSTHGGAFQRGHKALALGQAIGQGHDQEGDQAWAAQG